MGKLGLLRPQVRSLPPRLAYTQDDRAKDKRTLPPAVWKRWYKLKRWLDLRQATFVRDLYTCRMCRKISSNDSLLTADHIEPHRGDPRLFWDPANIQTLCTDPCHNTHKQRLEQRAARRA